MHAIIALLLLVVCVRSDDSKMNAAYKRARETLDPNNDFASSEFEYRMEQLAKCKPYVCESHGTSTELSGAEITWFKTIHRAVITLRHTYPKETGKVWCAIHSLLQDPQMCQMHHASSLVASLTFLIQKDLASDQLVNDLNEKDTKPVLGRRARQKRDPVLWQEFDGETKRLNPSTDGTTVQFNPRDPPGVQIPDGELRENTITEDDTAELEDDEVDTAEDIKLPPLPPATTASY